MDGFWRRDARVCFLAAAVLLISAMWFERSVAGQAARPASPAGKAIYDQRCAACHGTGGKGDGPASATLAPAPRDFTSGKYKLRSTESGSLPTDEDLATTIANGNHGTAMPDWKPLLTDADIKTVIAYIKSFSPRFATETPSSIPPPKPVPATPQSVAAGKAAYEKLQCGKCHGTDGEGTDAVARDMTDDWGNPIAATNLTEPWTFRGGSTASDIYLRFRAGMNGSPMPSFLEASTEKEMFDLANYVVSLARKPAWEMTAEELKAFYKKQEEETRQNPIARGRYLVETLGCSFCHSPIDKDGKVDKKMKYAGGQRMRVTPFGDFVSYNLTSDKETGLGGWTDQQIKTFLTTGTRRDGSRMLPFPMPWPSYASMKSSDLDAIVAYLRTIQPISNHIPAPERPILPVYLYGKFRLLILKEDPPAYIYPGNAGTPASAQRRAAVEGAAR